MHKILHPENHQIRAYVRNLLVLLGIDANTNRAAVLDYELRFTGREIRKNRYSDGTKHDDSKIHHHPVRTALTEDRYPVALLHSFVHEI